MIKCFKGNKLEDFRYRFYVEIFSFFFACLRGEKDISLQGRNDSYDNTQKHTYQEIALY